MHFLLYNFNVTGLAVVNGSIARDQLLSHAGWHSTRYDIFLTYLPLLPATSIFLIRADGRFAAAPTQAVAQNLIDLGFYQVDADEFQKFARTHPPLQPHHQVPWLTIDQEDEPYAPA